MAQLLGFYINPHSGGGMGKRVYDYLPEIMYSLGFDRDAWTAELSLEKDATAPLTRLFAECYRIIAVGGDGTLGAVLAHVANNPTHVDVGLLPLGTGNDLARAMGVYPIFHSRGVMGCLHRLIRAPISEFTLWEANPNTTFSAYISIGCDAAILHDFAERRRKGLFFSHPLVNKAIYLWYSNKHLSTRFSSKQISVFTSADKQLVWKKTRLRSVIISNISSYGGGTKLFNGMELPQKHLHLFIAYTYLDLVRILLLPRILPEWMLRRMPYPHHSTHTSLKVEMQGVPWQIDGEDIGQPQQKTVLQIGMRCKVRLIDLRKGSFKLFN